MTRLPVTRQAVSGHIFEIRHSLVKGFTAVYIHRSRDMIHVADSTDAGRHFLNPEGRQGPWIRTSRGSAIATADMMAGGYGGWREGSVWLGSAE